jgi:hypothetical protein
LHSKTLVGEKARDPVPSERAGSLVKMGIARKVESSVG